MGPGLKASQTVNIYKPYGWVVPVFNLFLLFSQTALSFRGKGIKTEINGILPLESVPSQGFAAGGGGRLETISREVTKVSIELFVFYYQKYLSSFSILKMDFLNKVFKNIV